MPPSSSKSVPFKVAVAVAVAVAVILPLLSSSALALAAGDNNIVRMKRVAITGTTGKLGREAIQLLSSQGVETRCLLRHAIDGPSVSPSIDDTATSAQVAAYLSSLPGVTMVPGDATSAGSCAELVRGCDAVLALHGPSKPNPLASLLRLLPESDPKHSRSVNYVAVRHIIDAMRGEENCRRLVRVTGKGEQPTQFFTVLINALGHMAKAWNYEGEQLLRNSGLDYTIIRPGVMTSADRVPNGKVLALADDGGDLPVTPVSHKQIAQLCVECPTHPNAAKATLTAMNVKDGSGEDAYAPLLKTVAPDRRTFPQTLLEEHKRGARNGAAKLVVFSAVFAAGFGAVLKALVGVAMGAFASFSS